MVAATNTPVGRETGRGSLAATHLPATRRVPVELAPVRAGWARWLPRLQRAIPSAGLDERAKFRCDSTLAQGTSAQSRRSRCEGKEHYPQARQAPPVQKRPEKRVNPSLGLRRGVHAAHGFRSASGPESPPARTVLPLLASHGLRLGCALRSNVLTC